MNAAEKLLLYYNSPAVSSPLRVALAYCDFPRSVFSASIRPHISRMFGLLFTGRIFPAADAFTKAVVPTVPC